MKDGRWSSRLPMLALGALLGMAAVAGAWALWSAGETSGATRALQAPASESPTGAASAEDGPAANERVTLPEDGWRELAEEIRGLRAELAEWRTQESERRAVQPANVETLERLEDLVRRVESVGATVGTVREPLVVRSREQNVGALSELAAAMEQAKSMDAEDELARGFFFLTSQEILDRFGVPNQISVTSGGEQLWRFDGPEAGPSYRLFFRFHEGRLIRMQ